MQPPTLPKPSAKPLLPGKPKKPIQPPAAVEAAKQRFKAAVGKLGGKGTPGGPLFQQFIETLAEGGEEGQELARQIADRARAELDKRRNLVAPLHELAAPFISAHSRVSFQRDIAEPARRRQLTSQELMDRINAKCFPTLRGGIKLLEFAERYFGPLTVGLGVGVEGGAGVGAEFGFGIAGLRHHKVCVFDTRTVALGTYAEASASFQIGVSQGTPEDYWSWGVAIDGSLSAAYGVSAEFTISQIPVSIARPSLDRPFIVEYKCVGLGLSIGVGAPGGGVALGLTGTSAYTLAGNAS